MKMFVKNTLLAMTLSTGMVLANDKTTTILDSNEVLPQTVGADLPEHSQENATAWTSYSPEQKASIVGLKLTAGAAQGVLSLEAESSSVTYSPEQKASIVGLKLTAQVGQNELPQSAETTAPTYSPQQKAKIVGLALTAE